MTSSQLIPSKIDKKYAFLLWLVLLLLIKSILALLIIDLNQIGLSPDEAQYWTWGKALDWGYYSKPPAIAWQIRLGTEFFGDTVFGIRFTAVVISAALSLATYLLALCCGLQPRSAFWAGVIMALSPMGILASFLATTDGGFILFWTLACSTIAHALYKKSPLSPFLLGLCIACGALYKWPIYLLWIALLPMLWKAPFLLTKELASNFIISFLGLLPSVVWNLSHEWATFRHVGATVQGGPKVGGTSHLGLAYGNFWEFLGAQAGLLSPILFFFLIVAFIRLIKERNSAPLSVFFCGMLSLILLVFYSLAAVFQKMQGNWVVFAYPSGIVLLCWYLCERVTWGKKWLWVGTGLSIVLTSFIVALPYVHSHNIAKSWPIPCKISPFRHSIGWSNLPQALQNAGYNPKTDFLFGDKYQTSSILSFYSPEQKRAYFLNLQGSRKNQFSFWPSMAETQKGNNGFFVWIINAPYEQAMIDKAAIVVQELLKPYFSSVELALVKPLFYCYDKPIKMALIFKGVEYNGLEPNPTELY